MTKPSAEAAAAGLKVPGLVLATPDDAKSCAPTPSGGPGLERFGSASGRQGRRRRTGRETAPGLAPRSAGSSTRTQKTVRALLTGFLMHRLTGDGLSRLRRSGGGAAAHSAAGPGRPAGDRRGPDRGPVP